MGKGKERDFELVKMALEAGKMSAEREVKDTYRATERRLYALLILKEKIKEDKARLEELIMLGPGECSKGITRFQRSGVRLEPEDIKDAAIMDLKATIAADEYEVETIEAALKQIENEPYYFTVEGKYLMRLTDDEIADKIHCDKSTVYRNRKNLIQTISVRLYGSRAVV